ncbi:MAG: T9SS type A sorting domain-containing protein [Bacteroidetes bacterium]|nr:T9SS type A sorting domain-containing protein [Bacteroidota bacterium]
MILPICGCSNIGFDAKDNKEYIIRISNILGEIVQEQNVSVFQGYYTREVTLSSHAKGIYLLSINDEEKSFKKKIIVY